MDSFAEVGVLLLGKLAFVEHGVAFLLEEGERKLCS